MSLGKCRTVLDFPGHNTVTVMKYGERERFIHQFQLDNAQEKTLLIAPLLGNSSTFSELGSMLIRN